MVRLCNECNRFPINGGKYSKKCELCTLKSNVAGTSKAKFNIKLKLFWKEMAL